MRQLKHISVHQTAKVIGLTYLAIFAVFAIPALIFFLVQGIQQQVLLALLAPFVYAAFAYLGTVLFVFFYNFVAARFGGIEFSTEDDSQNQV